MGALHSWRDDSHAGLRCGHQGRAISPCYRGYAESVPMNRSICARVAVHGRHDHDHEVGEAEHEAEHAEARRPLAVREQRGADRDPERHGRGEQRDEAGRDAVGGDHRQRAAADERRTAGCPRSRDRAKSGVARTRRRARDHASRIAPANAMRAPLVKNAVSPPCMATRWPRNTEPPTRYIAANARMIWTRDGVTAMGRARGCGRSRCAGSRSCPRRCG